MNNASGDIHRVITAKTMFSAKPWIVNGIYVVVFLHVE